MTSVSSMIVLVPYSGIFCRMYKNFMQCVAPTHVAVIKIVTQTPKYIFLADSEQHDSLSLANFRGGCSVLGVAFNAGADDVVCDIVGGCAVVVAIVVDIVTVVAFDALTVVDVDVVGNVTVVATCENGWDGDASFDTVTVTLLHGTWTHVTLSRFSGCDNEFKRDICGLLVCKIFVKPLPPSTNELFGESPVTTTDGARTRGLNIAGISLSRVIFPTILMNSSPHTLALSMFSSEKSE